MGIINSFIAELIERLGRDDHSTEESDKNSDTGK